MQALNPRWPQTFSDLSEDFTTLHWIAETGLARVQSFRAYLLTDRSSFPEETRRVLESMLQVLLIRYQEVIHKLHHRGVHREQTESVFEQELLIKQQTSNELRSLQLLTASTLVAGDWQSPSYEHSHVSEAGRQTGMIRGTYNDYNRDHHCSAEAYERKFVAAYVDGLRRPLVRALATSSGMAAFATVLAFVQAHLQPEDVVVVGKQVYFQNKQLVLQCFGSRVIWANEANTEAFMEVVRQKNPRAIFLDTLCNTPEMELPDLEQLIPRLSREVAHSTYLIFDNSVRAASFQPLQILPVFSKLELIVLESLNKYYQFGFDRVTGGIVWALGRVAGQLFTTRMHLGTNISDVSALALVEPNRVLLDRRLARIQRNTRELAEAIETALSSEEESEISHVVYPGLPSHPSFAWAKEQSFTGGSFMLQFVPASAQVARYDRFLSALMKLAKKRHIPLIAGTSFGFDVTRIYLTARHASEHCQPFVRISLGTETAFEMERMKNLFIDAIRM